MALEWYYCVIETYIALVAYYVLHIIYVIAGDFIEAFSIPPLNIGIYIDKLASIRALLMSIADIFEWAITQKWLPVSDAGAYMMLSDSKASRRHGSVLSILAMLVCRIVYLWLVYYSNNKSLDVFITLTVEGFWFGYFQMGFFAIGPEYNAFTSFALHLTGNFVFFFQIILNKLAVTWPKITCTYRVRVHAWIAFVTTFIALGPWIYFCQSYIKGDSSAFKALVQEVAGKIKDQLNEQLSGNSASQIAEALAGKIESGLKEALKSAGGVSSQIQDLLQSGEDFGLTDAEVGAGKTVELSSNGDSATVHGQSQDYTISPSRSGKTVTVEIKGTAGAGTEKKTKTDRQALRIAYTLYKALSRISSVEVKVNSSNGSTVEVKLSHHGQEEEIKTTITGNGTITVEVDGYASTDLKDKILEKLNNELGSLSLSTNAATGEPNTVKVEITKGQDSITGHGNVGKTNSLSPLLLFPAGSVIKDFMYPGILPFAFLDPERANLVNYTMPVFYMSGAFFVLFVNDVFHPTGFAKDLGGDSWFKDWSENEGNGRIYHGFWLLNLVMLAALVVALLSIHGIYPHLRCLVQCRWRIMLMTLAVLIPRSHLEIMGYVGTANYAILAGDLGDYSGW